MDYTLNKALGGNEFSSVLHDKCGQDREVWIGNMSIPLFAGELFERAAKRTDKEVYDFSLCLRVVGEQPVLHIYLFSLPFGRIHPN